MGIYDPAMKTGPKRQKLELKFLSISLNSGYGTVSALMQDLALNSEVK